MNSIVVLSISVIHVYTDYEEAIILFQDIFPKFFRSLLLCHRLNSQLISFITSCDFLTNPNCCGPALCFLSLYLKRCPCFGSSFNFPCAQGRHDVLSSPIKETIAEAWRFIVEKKQGWGKLPSFRTISFRHQDLGTQQLPLLAACTVWLLIFFTQLAESWGSDFSYAGSLDALSSLVIKTIPI
jgi:hypothetical protein